MKTPPYPLGTVLAGYQLLRVIGVGGLGAVYEALHLFTQRPVALKLLLPDHAASADLRERARREAIALCRVQHRNVVSVHSADMLADGTVYLAMELLTGTSLRRVCETEAPLPVARALYIAAEIADGLGAIHELGIVHRDVKPENVHIDGQDLVKVLDLNIAKLSIDGATTTKPGQQLGTTAYASPEQCAGVPCSTASDVYSLFLLTYEMLAGRHPFATCRGLAGLPCEAELVAGHVLRMPVPVHELVPSVPDYVWPALQRGLAKRAVARFEHGREAANTLRRLWDRYLDDVHAGRIQADTPAPGQPGARRQHRAPSVPPRLFSVPMPAEPRVIVAGAATEVGPAATAETVLAATAEAGRRAAAEAGRGAGAEMGRGAETEMGRGAAVEAVAAARAAVEAGPRSKRTVTPAPVTVSSSIGGAPASRAPLTLRLFDPKRARLVRRCLAAAALAIPVSGAATALSLHVGQGPGALAPEATAASPPGAPAAAAHDGAGHEDAGPRADQRPTEAAPSAPATAASSPAPSSDADGAARSRPTAGRDPAGAPQQPAQQPPAQQQPAQQPQRPPASPQPAQRPQRSPASPRPAPAPATTTAPASTPAAPPASTPAAPPRPF